MSRTRSRGLQCFRMWRGTRLLVVFGIAIWMVCSGQSLPTETIFPSDARDSRAVDAELLQAVCPGDVVIGKEIKCRGVCPKFTGFGGEDMEWQLARVTRGHFLSPTTDDAVLWMSGCEPHGANWGGTILLTRRSEKWTIVWYKAGVPTAQCHKVQLADRREILVCLGSYGGQGTVITALYVEDMLAPVGTLMTGTGRGHFFEAVDDVYGCVPKMARANIEKVTFSRDAEGRSVVSATGQTGSRTIGADEAIECGKNPMAFAPPTKPYRADFVFDGREDKPVRAGR